MEMKTIGWKCKASLGRSSAGLGQFLLTCVGVVFPWQALNFTAFVACDILIYVEIRKEWHTRPEKHDHRTNVPQLKSRMLVSFWSSTEIPMAYKWYYCLNHIIGLCRCFLDGSQKGPSWRVVLQWAQSLASISLEERFLEGGGSMVWWRETRHEFQRQRTCI